MRRAIGAFACAAAVCAALSPPARAAPTNGQLAAVAGQRIVTLNADGSGLRALWTPAADGDQLSGLAWSPDGNRLAFAHAGRIVIYDVAERRPLAATSPPDGTRDADPGWSADGTRIGFRRSGSLTQAAITMGADGSDPQRVAINPDTTALAWAPDLARVALVVGGQLRLPVLDLLLASGVAGVPAWSPDGSRIAFAGADGLSVVAAPIGLPVPIAAGPAGSPRWSPDGHGLVYPAPSELRIVAAEGGTPQVVLRAPGVRATDWQPCTEGVTASCESVSPPQCTLAAVTVATQSDQPVRLPPPPCADPAGRPMAPVVTKPPDHGTLTGWTYTPAPGFTGQDVVVYRMSNGTSASEPVRLTIFVVPVPRPAPAIAPPPPRPPPPARRAPFLSARATPRLDRHRSTLVRLACDQDCSLSVRLTARLRSRKTLKGTVAKRAVVADRVLTLRLRLPTKPRGTPKTVWITGTVRNAAGDTRAVKLPVTLPR